MSINEFYIEEDILELAINKLGIDNQTIIAIEELSELQKEICKYRRNKYNEEHMAEEISHSILMIQQMMTLYNNKRVVKKYYDEAVERLVKLLD